MNITKKSLRQQMEAPTNITCTRSSFNNQCLKSNCPFFVQAFKI